jgi:membrane associated rhomboid family serine protease
LAFFVPTRGPGPAGRQPVVNLPPVVRTLLLVLAAVHLVRLALPADLDWWVIATFAFIPARYSVPGFFDWGAVAAPLTHMLLHDGWAHLLINMVMLAAFGAGVERRIGGRRMLAFAVICGLAGAAAHSVVYPESLSPVIGASGAISGLFGGILRLLPGRHPGQGLRGLWPLIVVWVAINVVFGLTGAPGAEGEIAWVAHLGGFGAGLLFYGPFDRPRMMPPG